MDRAACLAISRERKYEPVHKLDFAHESAKKSAEFASLLATSYQRGLTLDQACLGQRFCMHGESQCLQIV